MKRTISFLRLAHFVSTTTTIIIISLHVLNGGLVNNIQAQSSVAIPQHHQSKMEMQKYDQDLLYALFYGHRTINQTSSTTTFKNEAILTARTMNDDGRVGDKIFRIASSILCIKIDNMNTI